ncbi:MAG: hypothetical protein V9E85_10185 [Candidatus Nanopelagicales bacterium]
MAKPGDSHLRRQRYRVILRGPHGGGIRAVSAIFGHRTAQPKPLSVRLTAGVQVEARMVGEDLQARPNDEDHEEEVEEVLPAQPPRESRIDRGHIVAGRTGVLVGEVLVPLLVRQLANDGD